MTEHNTKEVDQLSVIRGLLERQATRSEALDAKVDALRAEGSARGLEQAAFNKRFEADLGNVRHEVQRLSQRVGDVESDLSDMKGDIRDLEDADRVLTRQHSESDLEVEAAIGGAISHVSRMDEAFSELRENDRQQNETLHKLQENDAKRDRVDQALCQVMGVDYAAVSTPPPADADEAMALEKRTQPKTDLIGLAKGNKKATAAAALAFLTALVQLALELAKH